MAASIFTVLLIVALSVATADIKVSDYVYWKKADISAWHQYFPSRALQEESLTNINAQGATWSVEQGLEDSLRIVVRYQAQELATAQLMMEGTSAQGCIKGISPFMNNAIDDEISSFQDCAADVIPRLQRAAAKLSKVSTTYQKVYESALEGITNCSKTYPNKDSLIRLRTCVEAWNKNYFTMANATRRYNALVSPSMSIFITVAECAQTAAKNVVDKGWEFLKKLAYCANLSENIDAQEYLAQVTSGYSKYLTQNDLTSQIQLAQVLHNQKVSEIEQEMLFYYDLQKRALENYVIESRGAGHYYSQVAGYLSGYYSTIAATSNDNPGDVECISAAYSSLDSVVNVGSSSALLCDQNIVADTKNLLSKVNSEFGSVNSFLPYTGNFAILYCLSQGYIFAEKTIINCFNVTASGYLVDYSDVHDRVVKDVATLLGYESNFFVNSSLPCGESVLRRAYSGAERVLYDLQRCLYIGSRTNTAPVTVPTVGSALDY